MSRKGKLYSRRDGVRDRIERDRLAQAEQLMHELARYNRSLKAPAKSDTPPAGQGGDEGAAGKGGPET